MKKRWLYPEERKTMFSGQEEFNSIIRGRGRLVSSKAKKAKKLESKR